MREATGPGWWEGGVSERVMKVVREDVIEGVREG